MAIRGRIYKGAVQAVSGNQTIAVIGDLDTVMEDNSSAVADIYSWTYNPSTPENIVEYSGFEHRQLLIKKSSGAITIENTSIIQEITTSGGMNIVWEEILSGTTINLDAVITGLNATAFRRAYVKMVKA